MITPQTYSLEYAAYGGLGGAGAGGLIAGLATRRVEYGVLGCLAGGLACGVPAWLYGDGQVWGCEGLNFTEADRPYVSATGHMDTKVQYLKFEDGFIKVKRPVEHGLFYLTVAFPKPINRFGGFKQIVIEASSPVEGARVNAQLMTKVDNVYYWYPAMVMERPGAPMRKLSSTVAPYTFPRSQFELTGKIDKPLLWLNLHCTEEIWLKSFRFTK
jgi:hypothetical protein